MGAEVLVIGAYKVLFMAFLTFVNFCITIQPLNSNKPGVIRWGLFLLIEYLILDLMWLGYIKSVL